MNNVNNVPWLGLSRGLLDINVFILWYHGNADAKFCLRQTRTDWYYTKATRKELLRPPISEAEKQKIMALLAMLRVIKPDDEIAAAFPDLLRPYPYLRDHRIDALIAATALVKSLPVITTNVRHLRRFWK
jgi:predicted nucleic acid-binding protein